MVNEQAQADFDRAMSKAFRRDLRSFFCRQPNRLIPFHEVQARLGIQSQQYKGMQTVPIDRIVGSFDRFQDFDRAFLPRKRHVAARWKSIDRAHLMDVHLPPVQLYKVGDIYFVKDGNHRVSVARERGVEFIDAEVVEAPIRTPIYAAMSPQQILLQLEYASFLRRTNLDRSRPEHDIRPTALGRYDQLIEDIAETGPVDPANAAHTPVSDLAADWYDHRYLPLIKSFRKREILKKFPGRTEADLYLWVMDRQVEFLPEGGGDDIDIEAASKALAESAPNLLMHHPIEFASRMAKSTVDRAARLTHLRHDDGDEAKT